MIYRFEYSDKKGWLRLEKPDTIHVSDNGFVKLHPAIDEAFADMFIFLMKKKFPNLKSVGMGLIYPSNEIIEKEFELFKADFDVDD